MANSKQKPAVSEEERVKRSPGKSKFSIPRRETPPIDGSYLDRLFADFDRQTKEGWAGNLTSENAPAAETISRPVETEAPAGATTSEPTAPASTTVAARPTVVTSPDASARVDRFSPVKDGKQPEKLDSIVRGTTRTAAPGDTKKRSTSESEVRAAIPPPAARLPQGDYGAVQKLVKIHRLSKGEARVLNEMVRLCDETGSDVCYVKIPYLTARTGLKDRQTQRVLKSLSELNLIERLAEYSNADRLGIRYRVISVNSFTSSK